MEREIKFYTVAEALMQTTVPVKEALQGAEQSYRRGCHQTCAIIYGLLDSCEDIQSSRELVGILEDVLCEYREDLDNRRLDLLHDAVREARRRQP